MVAFVEEAHSIRADINSDVSPLPSESIDILNLETDEVFDLLNSVQPRLFAITAVLGDMTLNHFDRFRQQFPPFGLQQRTVEKHGYAKEPTPVDELKTLNQLELAMYLTIKAARVDLFTELQGNPHFIKWYEEADHLLDYFRKVSDKEELWGQYKSPEGFLEGGLGTGTDVCTRTLDLVDEAHQVFAPDASDEEIQETARRARTIPHKLASTIEFERIMEALNALGGVPWHAFRGSGAAFSMDRFNITPSPKNPNILNIKYSDASLANPEAPHPNLSSIETRLGRLGCPGLVDFSSTEDPFTNSIDRVYAELVKSATDLCLWRSDKRLSKTHTPSYLI